jgi:phosphoribosylformylglycinamidine synthase
MHKSLPTHRFIVSHRPDHDHHAHVLLQAAQKLGFDELSSLTCHDIYFIQGDLSATDKSQIATKLLSDPVVQHWLTEDETILHDQNQQFIEIALRPGVTDPVAEQINRAAKEIGINTVTQVATGQRFIIRASRILNNNELNLIAHRLLMNPVIHHFTLGKITPLFPENATARHETEIISLRHLNEQQLLALSQDRRSALSLDEMVTIQHYYLKLDRDPTDVEFETIAQTWSEHCSHKTFKADISVEQNNQKIHGLLNTYIRAATEKIAAPWVWSAFVDNAGIIDFDEEYQIAFKVETHNHPSAIEPFGGANTGLGGVIRDVLGVSAKPIAATDIFCFGLPDINSEKLPEGVLHPARIREGVVAGVQDYGNKTGIPTVNGAVWYDQGYTANPLVFCGCVGLIPNHQHPRNPLPGDRIILLGGRTGRDGLRGATFSSMTMDAQTGEVAGASVQIGNPLIAKGLIEVTVRARDAKIYHAITDCGAGGLSSAVGEMASNIGAEVNLDMVQLKYSGLAPWEIWLSEAQERMVLAVPTDKVSELSHLCEIYDIELTDLGYFTDTNHLRVRYKNQLVLDLANEFLFDGMPLKSLIADLSNNENNYVTHSNTAQNNLNEILLQLLSDLNIASKAAIIRLYDHEVQGGTVVKPLTGIKNDGPADACVLKPQYTKGLKGIVLANGLNPEYGKYDPYRMALSVIDEAIRNAVAVGANPDRIAILDNFCWGNPNDPKILGALVATCKGCYDAAVYYGTPFISGKDSLNNEYFAADGKRHAIPHTLLISALGIIDDVTKAVTLDFKNAGNHIYLIGGKSGSFLGSHFIKIGGKANEMGNVPDLPQNSREIYRSLHRAMSAGLVKSCHDLSEGGLAVAIAEMCMAGRLGCDLKLNGENIDGQVFGEGNGRLLVELAPENVKDFLACFTDQLITDVNLVGIVTNTSYLNINHNDQQIISLTIDDLLIAWQGNI